MAVLVFDVVAFAVVCVDAVVVTGVDLELAVFWVCFADHAAQHIFNCNRTCLCFCVLLMCVFVCLFV